MKKIGFIDYYLDEWHANQYPAWIRDATGGAMEVAFAYGMKDAGHGLSNKEWCAKNGVTPCGTIEEVVARSDYLIVLSPDNPEQHEALAELPLASGKPTYIDKTFAPDRAAALRLFERAARHRTPLYSSSALRYAAEYAEVEREGIQVISSWGPGLLENYSIHQIEPIVALMGTEAKRVMYTGTAAAPALLIEFSGGRQATIQQPGPGCPFTMAVNYASGACRVVQPASDFFQSFIRDLARFFETGEAAVPPAETIAVISIIENGLIAAKQPYQWIELPESG
ncbi:hypothetical protein VQ056_27375 [Paenibacillus sp. JTLBN-2024]|jgi:hypothetical protein|uniref:Oxidoreductase n=1 Tax=Paenibacillus cookii TaxID=157839 RepID=A0ABQ4LYR6_9BACL|nr:hypothetical protein [Paenibacillus cookii]GIO68426.1 hypothetical protein J21TS3_32470 [Paenibacillus cookii]HWO53426.1 hypothetical protein [Paenibacillus cookii]